MSSGDLGALGVHAVLSLLSSADSVHREPTLCQAGLAQALHLICSSNGPVRWLLLSSLPLKKYYVFGCIASQLHYAGSFLAVHGLSSCGARA